MPAFRSALAVIAMAAASALLVLTRGATAASSVAGARSAFVAAPAGRAWGLAKAPAATARRMGTIAMASPEAIIQDAIKKPVVVFSKTYCPYCSKAKQVLTNEGAKFDVIELDTRKDGDAIQAELAKMTGRRTVPNVFVSGKTIGGGDDTAALSASGKLKDMLKAAGAL